MGNNSQSTARIADIAEKLRSSQSVVLSTHRHCDGDGLGAQLALAAGLRRMGKTAHVVNVDAPSDRYGFLVGTAQITVYNGRNLPAADLALILDTNDARLVEPLFSRLKSSVKEIIFIDHHPTLTHGPAPTPGSLVDTTAASTGELSYRILQALGTPLDAEIARALYTSVVFDTQLFRYVKSAPNSHRMAADILAYEKNPEEVHRRLFATYTVSKMNFLIRALAQVEYRENDRIAFIPLRSENFPSGEGGLEKDESGDVIDHVMNIESIEVAALLREDRPGHYKLSLRSRGDASVLAIAEHFGGGGHHFAAGAHLEGTYADLHTRLLKALSDVLKPLARSSTK